MVDPSGQTSDLHSLATDGPVATDYTVAQMIVNVPKATNLGAGSVREKEKESSLLFFSFYDCQVEKISNDFIYKV